jgi:type 1 glutamine amidotransferase
MFEIFRPMRYLSLVACLSLFISVGLAPAAESPRPIRVLLITGDDASPAHDWLGCAAATRTVLVESGTFDVKVLGNPNGLEIQANLDDADVIYLLMYNASTPTISEQAKQNLLNFVKHGKGFVVAHLGSASFKEWEEFKRLCGRAWVMGESGHGPRSVFRAQIADPDHPITRGLTDFQQDDELYAKLQGDGPIHVLVTAASDWSQQTEPLAFVLSYGVGRVFHHTFGHDPKAINSPSVKTLITRGTAWAAGRTE